MLSNHTKKTLKFSPKSGGPKTLLTKRGYAIMKKNFTLEDITDDDVYEDLLEELETESKSIH